MKFLRWVKPAAVMLACLGMVLPVPVAHAERGTVKTSSTVPTSAARTIRGQEVRPAEGVDYQLDTKVRDVALASQGTLRGQVLDSTGKPQPGVAIMLVRDGREVGSTVTGDRGEFALTNLRGGIYQLAAGQYTGVYRIWSPQTAPPVATDGVLIVASGDVLRGQCFRAPHGLKHWLVNPWFMAAVAAAAIAIPVAVHNANLDDAS